MKHWLTVSEHNYCWHNDHILLYLLIILRWIFFNKWTTQLLPRSYKLLMFKPITISMWDIFMSTLAIQILDRKYQENRIISVRDTEDSLHRNRTLFCIKNINKMKIERNIKKYIIKLLFRNIKLNIHWHHKNNV